MAEAGGSARPITSPLGKRLVRIGMSGYVSSLILGLVVVVATVWKLVPACSLYWAAATASPQQVPMAEMMAVGRLLLGLTFGALLISLGQALRWGLAALAEILENQARPGE